MIDPPKIIPAMDFNPFKAEAQVKVMVSVKIRGAERNLSATIR